MRAATTAIMIFLIVAALIAGCAKQNVTGHAVVKIRSDLKQSDANNSTKTADTAEGGNGCNPDVGEILGTDNPTL